MALRNVAAAVSVVSTFDSDGSPYGTTVSAFTPLSMDPALLLVSLANSSRLLSLLNPGTVLGINVLSAEQADIGERFAQRDPGRWTGVGWEARAGAPALIERHAFISAAVRQLIRAGDHTLVVSAVRCADRSVGEPLVYWQQGFGTFGS
jgi:flavin reductase (DIM6/NTAB) family NADH-FMN oxidoreductase RutF